MTNQDGGGGAAKSMSTTNDTKESSHDRPHEPRRLQQTSGRWVSLYPVGPADYDMLRRAEISDDLGVSWRLSGSTPSPEAYVQSLWAGVLAQFLVVTNRDSRVLGLVAAYNADLSSGTCYVAFARFDTKDKSPAMVEGIVLFVDHLFSNWTFRKLYGESAGYNLGQLQTPIQRLLVEEGRLRDHVYAGGRYWDLHILALYRSTWDEWRSRLLPTSAPIEDPTMSVTVSPPRT